MKTRCIFLVLWPTFIIFSQPLWVIFFVSVLIGTSVNYKAISQHGKMIDCLRQMVNCLRQSRLATLAYNWMWISPFWGGGYYVYQTILKLLVSDIFSETKRVFKVKKWASFFARPKPPLSGFRKGAALRPFCLFCASFWRCVSHLRALNCQYVIF